MMTGGASVIMAMGVTPSSVAGQTPADKVFVVGATGKTGSACVRALMSRGIPVVAGVRSISKARSKTGFQEEEGILQLVECDVTKGVVPLASVMNGCTAVICATGFPPSLNLQKDNAKQVDN